MAWIYFQESAELASPCPIMSEQSSIVSKTDTHRAFFCRVCNRVILTERQSGMTCELCEKNTYQKSISSSAASHVRTSALQEMESAWQESEADFFSKLSDLQMKFSRRLCSSKTYQQLELADFERLSEHLPIFGMIVDGLVYLPQKLAPRTFENVGSFCANDGGLWPTPTIHGNYQNKIQGNSHLIGLATAVKRWPTPNARDWKGAPSAKHEAYSLPREVGGHLNPKWVEWLMGYQIEWTELNASVMQWFRSKRKQHLKGLREFYEINI